MSRTRDIEDRRQEFLATLAKAAALKAGPSLSALPPGLLTDRGPGDAQTPATAPAWSDYLALAHRCASLEAKLSLAEAARTLACKERETAQDERDELWRTVEELHGLPAFFDLVGKEFPEDRLPQP